LNPIGYLGHVK